VVDVVVVAGGTVVVVVVVEGGEVVVVVLVVGTGTVVGGTGGTVVGAASDVHAPVMRAVTVRATSERDAEITSSDRNPRGRYRNRAGVPAGLRYVPGSRSQQVTMRIVVIGAGAVGSHLADRLSHEGQDVIVIESDATRADEVQAEIDCLVIHGNGASHETLKQAGVDRSDLVIAVSSSDAVNVLAAHAAGRLGSAQRIARVEDPQLRDEALALGVDLLIDPVEATAGELVVLLKQRGVAELIEFADGRLDLIGGFIAPDAPVAGLTLAELRESVSGWSWIVVAIVRDGETMIARGSTKVLPGDHVLFMAETDNAKQAYTMLGIHEQPANKVAILGATRLARRTAAGLCEEGIQTLIVDQDPERMLEITESLPRAIGVVGDPTDPKLLQSEGIDTADAVLALTGWDEINILGCLVAKAVGVPTTVARLHRHDLVRLLAGVGIDTGVSTRLTAAGEILKFVRGGGVHSVVTFQDSDAEAIEVEVGRQSPAAGKTLRDLHLSHELIVGGVIRGDTVFVPRGDSTIEVGDHLIVIALPTAVHEVEQLSG
jgi:trk system potassium uptake protein TrkA